MEEKKRNNKAFSKNSDSNVLLFLWIFLRNRQLRIQLLP